MILRRSTGCWDRFPSGSGLNRRTLAMSKPQPACRPT